MSDEPAPDPNKIRWLPARVSRLFRDSETLVVAYATGLIAGVPPIAAEVANALGEPTFKLELDKLIADHPHIAHWYPITVAGLTYWARTRRQSKDPV